MTKVLEKSRAIPLFTPRTYVTYKKGENATICLLWQHWTKALEWFDDVDISAFHSCIVVDLWQSLSEWHLLMSSYVVVSIYYHLELLIAPSVNTVALKTTRFLVTETILPLDICLFFKRKQRNIY